MTTFPQFSHEDSAPVQDFEADWLDQSENLNIGGDDEGIDLDDEYEGALDLDDLDSFSPSVDVDFDSRA